MLRAFEIGALRIRRQQPARVADPAEPAAQHLRAEASRRSGSTSWWSASAPRAVTRSRSSAPAITTWARRSRSGRRPSESTAQGVAVTKDVITSVRMGRATSVKKVKRAVQLIVDQVLNNETSLMGLTTIRDYDEYTFTHSVNVCIFSVALGKKARLSAAAALRPRHGGAAPRHREGAGAGRDPQQDDRSGRAGVARHAGASLARRADAVRHARVRRDALPVDPGGARAPHEDRPDAGIPGRIRPRELGIFSRIVAVADGFDAATTRRSYQTVPIEPDQVLREMWENPKRGYDPILVKALINLIGIYPVGTCVILDTFEVAIVAAPDPDGAAAQPAAGANRGRRRRRRRAAAGEPGEPHRAGRGRELPPLDREGHQPLALRPHGRRLLCLIPARTRLVGPSRRRRAPR